MQELQESFLSICMIFNKTKKIKQVGLDYIINGINIY